MALQQNQVPNDPELKDLLDLFKKQLLLGFNCHHVATIQTFNPLTQTATATVNYTKTLFLPNAAGVYSGVQTNYPILIDCLVVCLGGGGGFLTFPIAPGDECLVCFNDRDLGNWFSGGSGSECATARLHSFSDGVIIVGVRSMANVLKSYDALNVMLGNGENSISIGPTGDDIVIKLGSSLTATFKTAGGVNITNAIGSFDFKNDADVAFDTGTVQGLFGHGGKVSFTNAMGELITSIITLMTDIQNGLVTTMLGPEPLVMPTFTTDLLVLQSFKA